MMELRNTFSFVQFRRYRSLKILTYVYTLWFSTSSGLELERKQRHFKILFL